MKVLLTGGSGFLGRSVQEEIKNYNRDSKISADVIDVTVYSHKNDGCLTYKPHFQKLYYTNNYDAIVHLAAKVGGIGANQASPYDFIYENLQMGLNIVETITMSKRLNPNLKTPKIILVSTVCGYPANTEVPFKEQDIWNGYPEPTNAPYGIAKRTLAEVLWAANKQYGIQSTVLNLANLYGVGDSTDIVNNHVIAALFAKMVKYKVDKTPIQLWGDGTPSRDFLHTSDAAKAIVASLHSPQGPQFGINIGTGVETTIKQVVNKIARLVNIKESSIEWDNTRPNGQNRRCLDITLAKQLLNWSPSVSLDKGLLEIKDDIWRTRGW